MYKKSHINRLILEFYTQAGRFQKFLMFTRRILKIDYNFTCMDTLNQAKMAM